MSEDWNDGFDAGYQRGVEVANADMNLESVKESREWSFGEGVFVGFMVSAGVSLVVVVAFLTL